MEKVFKAEFESFKKHPDNPKLVTVYVREKTKKAANESALVELSFWDSEHVEDFRKANLTEITEGGDRILCDYMGSKESAGQMEVTEGEQEEGVAPLFDCKKAAVAEFPLVSIPNREYEGAISPIVLRMAIATRKKKVITSFSIINRSKNNTPLYGLLDVFDPKPFEKLENAIAYCFGQAIEAMSDCESVLGKESAAIAIEMLTGYAKGNESNPEKLFLENSIKELYIDLKLATIKGVQEVPILSPGINKLSAVLRDHPDYRRLTYPMPSVGVCGFINKVRANFIKLEEDYEVPFNEINEHIETMQNIEPLKDLGHCEELIGLYGAKYKGAPPEPITLTKQDLLTAVKENDALFIRDDKISDQKHIHHYEYKGVSFDVESLDEYEIMAEESFYNLIADNIEIKEIPEHVTIQEAKQPTSADQPEGVEISNESNNQSEKDTPANERSSDKKESELDNGRDISFDTAATACNDDNCNNGGLVITRDQYFPDDSPESEETEAPAHEATPKMDIWEVLETTQTLREATKECTRLWGPYGVDWGLINVNEEIQATRNGSIAFAKAHFFYGSANTFEVQVSSFHEIGYAEQLEERLLISALSMLGFDAINANQV